MKHLLLTAVILSGLVSTWAVVRSGRTHHLSVSLHVARTRSLQLRFGILLLIATTLSTITFFGWLLPHYDADTLAYAAFGVLIACFATIAIVPHIEGNWRGVIHNAVAWGMVYVILGVMLIVLSWPLSDVARWICIAILFTCIVLVLLSLTKKDLRRWFLYFQSSYLALFFAFLLVATYL